MKILHCADIHFGANTYGRIDPETGLNTRLLDFKRCFQFMVKRGIEENIDVFLFCGDAFHTPNPTPTQQREFTECLLPLAENNIPVVMVTGNHDHPVTYGKASSIDIFKHLKGNTHIFRRADYAIIETKSGPLQLIAMPWPVRSILLYGRKWQERSVTELPAHMEQLYVSKIAGFASKLKPNLPTVLAGHFTVNGATMGGSESSRLIHDEPKFSPAQLSVSPIDYVALGHIHHHQNLALTDEDPPVVYSSSIERVTFKEQNKSKGFVLVTIQGSPKRTTYEFVETPARRFVTIHVDATQKTDPTKAILKRISTTNIRDAIVRIRFKITESQRASLDLGQIRERLTPAFAVASIEHLTGPVEREQRSNVTSESTLKEALESYINQHERLIPLKNMLIAAGLELEKTLTNPSDAT